MKQFWRKNPGKNFHRKIFRVNYYFQCSIFFLILQRLEGFLWKLGGQVVGLWFYIFLNTFVILQISNEQTSSCWHENLSCECWNFSMEWSEAKWNEEFWFLFWNKILNQVQDDGKPFVIPAFEPESGVAPPPRRACPELVEGGGWEGLVFGIIIFKTPSNSPLSGGEHGNKILNQLQDDGDKIFPKKPFTKTSSSL